MPGACVLRSGSSMFRARFEAVRLGPDLTVSAAGRREMDLVSLLGSRGRRPCKLRTPILAGPSCCRFHAHVWAWDICTVLLVLGRLQVL